MFQSGSIKQCTKRLIDHALAHHKIKIIQIQRKTPIGFDINEMTFNNIGVHGFAIRR